MDSSEHDSANHEFRNQKGAEQKIPFEFKRPTLGKDINGYFETTSLLPDRPSRFILLKLAKQYYTNSGSLRIRPLDIGSRDHIPLLHELAEKGIVVEVPILISELNNMDLETLSAEIDLEKVDFQEILFRTLIQKYPASKDFWLQIQFKDARRSRKNPTESALRVQAAREKLLSSPIEPDIDAQFLTVVNEDMYLLFTAGIAFAHARQLPQPQVLLLQSQVSKNLDTIYAWYESEFQTRIQNLYYHLRKGFVQLFDQDKRIILFEKYNLTKEEIDDLLNTTDEWLVELAVRISTGRTETIVTPPIPIKKVERDIERPTMSGDLLLRITHTFEEYLRRLAVLSESEKVYANPREIEIFNDFGAVYIEYFQNVLAHDFVLQTVVSKISGISDFTRLTVEQIVSFCKTMVPKCEKYFSYSKEQVNAENQLAKTYQKIATLIEPIILADNSLSIAYFYFLILMDPDTINHARNQMASAVTHTGVQTRDDVLNDMRHFGASAAGKGNPWIGWSIRNSIRGNY
ncbi:MAG: hypothetical protein WAU07_05770 [Microgenomates group bacterium]